MSKLTVTSSPHIFTPRTTRSIMLDVLIALLPAAVASVILFGFSSLMVILTCMAAAVLSELVFNLICKKERRPFFRRYRSPSRAESPRDYSALAGRSRRNIRYCRCKVPVRRHRSELCKPGDHRKNFPAAVLQRHHDRRSIPTEC